MLTILVISAVCLSEVCGELHPTPWSVNYSIGHPDGWIVLPCQSTTDKESILWEFKGFGQNEYEVLYRYEAMEGNFGRTYEVQRNSTGPTALKIKTVSKSEAGEYKCSDNNGVGDSACAEVVVFEKDPNCTSKSIEGNQAEFCCSVGYWGNVAPNIIFLKESKVLTSGVADKSEINEQIRTAHNCTIVNRTENHNNYTCAIFLPPDDKCARKWKDPAYSHVCTFTATLPSSEQGDNGTNGVNKTADQPNSHDVSGNGTGWKVAAGCVGGGAVLVLAGVGWRKRDKFIGRNIDLHTEAEDPQEISPVKSADDATRKPNGGNTERMALNA